MKAIRRSTWVGLVLTLLIGCSQSEAPRQPTTSAVKSAEQQKYPVPPSQQTPSPQPAPHSQPALSYIEIVTGPASDKEALPLIVAVHGLGDAPEYFKELMEGLEVKTRVVLPRAPDPYGSGYAWFPYRFLTSNRNQLGLGINRAASMVAALIRKLVPPKESRLKPIITGFSQGGMISFAVAVEYPDLIRLSIPISGTLPSSLWPDSNKDAKRVARIRALHGTVDMVVPIQSTRKAVQALKQARFDVELKEYNGVGHNISDEMRSDLYQIIREELQNRSTVKSGS